MSTWGLFRLSYHSHQSLKLAWKLFFYYFFYFIEISQEPMSWYSRCSAWMKTQWLMNHHVQIGHLLEIIDTHIRVLYALYHSHDDVIKWKHFPRYWPFVRGIHRSAVNSPHKGQWRGALMFSLISAWINGWVNIGEAGDLRRHRAHYDVTVM